MDVQSQLLPSMLTKELPNQCPRDAEHPFSTTHQMNMQLSGMENIEARKAEKEITTR